MPRPRTTPRSRTTARRTRKGGGPAPAATASSREIAGAASRERVCLGAVTGAHGVRGTLRIRSFTERPEDIASYGPVSDESGDNEYELEIIGMSAGTVLARISGIDDRDAVAALKGARLYVARDALPPPEEDEFYHGDLLGLVAALPDGATLGPVVAIHPAGAAEALEIDRGRGVPRLLVPFTRAAVPVVDIAAGRIVVDPPPGLMDDEPGAEDAE